ncbi:MAG: hypothetical protein H0U54_14525 [Acidobacteria bacterium]|nr:hypothetical protein [Acidobacteriota bacterium]
MECCGVHTASNISPFPFFIEKESSGQATRSFVKTALTLKEEKSELRAIAIIVERCAAHGLFVEAIIFA